MITNPLDVLNNLEQRVAALEAQAGETPGVSTLQPNVITVDATGAIGANFTGHVHAQGVDLDAPSAPTAQDEIRWLKQPSGALVAAIDSYATGPFGTEQMDLMAYALAQGDASQITIRARDDQGQDAALLQIAQQARGTNNTAIVATAGRSPAGFVATLLDSTGASSFLQLAAPIRPSHRVFNFGAVTVTFTNSATSNEIAVTHGLTDSGGNPIDPNSVVFGSLGGASWAVCQVNNINYGPANHTQFSIVAHDAGNTVRTGTQTIYWAAFV